MSIQKVYLVSPSAPYGYQILTIVTYVIIAMIAAFNDLLYTTVCKYRDKHGYTEVI